MQIYLSFLFLGKESNNLNNQIKTELLMMPKILIIDDEKSIRNTLREILEYEKFSVDEACDGPEAIVKAKETKYDLVLCDIKMPKMDGIEVLSHLLETSDAPVIMISGHGTIETAVEALKKGAYDYIPKPLDLNRLLVTIRNAMDRSGLIQETKLLKRKISGATEMIGDSSAMEHVKGLISKVAPTDARVMITGENGTGKELVARWLHAMSKRAAGPFIEVNCAAIPAELIESQLFGHEKGSFTSAVKQHKGDFEQANGGTLFLDEVGDMSLPAQSKVLRALQENKITRVGGEKEIPVDVRIITATNKNLKEEIASKNFREDLFHRLSVIIIEVPPLRDRKDDIPRLADHFLEEFCNTMGKPRMEITSEALMELQKHNWTGNVRELRNIMERLTILCETKIELNDIQNNL
jgi:two-component system, NtrC family, nitrogen regulation response regulator NtrX